LNDASTKALIDIIVWGRLKPRKVDAERLKFKRESAKEKKEAEPVFLVHRRIVSSRKKEREAKGRGKERQREKSYLV